MISYFKTKVLLERSHFEEIVKQGWQWRLVARGLRKRLTEEHQLLLKALHELALAKQISDPQYFAMRWQADARAEPVPNWFRPAQRNSSPDPVEERR